MADHQYKGLREKYFVTRRDGGSEVGKRHFGCRYYVLDLDHDRHAIAALEAYAESCRQDYPQLAQDIIMVARTMRRNFEQNFNV